MNSPWIPGRSTVASCSLQRLPDELYERAWPLCFVLLAASVACLLIDLGRPDRILQFALTPQLTTMTIGAYALVAALALSAAFALRAWFFAPDSPFALYFPLIGVPLGILVGLLAAAYTGVLLMSLESVLFWQSLFLPATFLASSLSCGLACVLASAAFSSARLPFAFELARLMSFDALVMLAEAACLVALLAAAFALPGAQAAAHALVAGELRWAFWGGVVVCGMLMPATMGRFVTHSNYHNQCILIAAFVLAGGFALRYCIVQAGMFDATQMSCLLYGLSGFVD